MLSGAAGAYSGKIPFCAPMSRYRRGLLRQNPYLRPDIPVSTGLITAKSLSTPRCPGIDGAYYGKIPFCAPLVRDPRGLSWQNLLLRPAGPRSPGPILTKSLSTPRWFGFDGAYFDKISFCAPLVQKPAGIIGLVLSTIPSPTQIHKNTDRQISSLSISIFVCQYLFHQRSVTAGSPSRPRTLAAFLRKEPW